MKEIELYIHNANDRDPKLVKVHDDITVEELLKKVTPPGNGSLHLIVEGEEEPRSKSDKLSDCGIAHRHHVHCHHCKKIEVTVAYNGEESRSFPPSTTIEKVLHWALKAFHLKGADALNKVLRLPEAPNETLPESAHIGSFVSSSTCEVRLNLTGHVEVNG